MRLPGAVLALLVLLAGCGAPAPDATVAVASNFHDVALRLAADYRAGGGGELRLVSGSTGKLYAQIVAGAPFDAFLAADEARPARLEEQGLAVAGSGFVYAVGRLCLWRPDAPAGVDGAALLAGDGYRRLAVANPELAPYGAAARATLEALGARDALRNRLVMGENVGQAYALVATGNADWGLVALAQLRMPGATPRACPWLVPADLHEPIRQRAVLLADAASRPAARGFLDYLQSPAARATIAAAGYDVD